MTANCIAQVNMLIYKYADDNKNCNAFPLYLVILLTDYGKIVMSVVLMICSVHKCLF